MHPEALIPSGDAMHRLGVTARAACAVMLRSRAELIDMHKNVPPESVDAMMDAFMEGKRDLAALVGMIEAAFARTVAAACKLQVSGWK
jgi:hypothetical protein